MIWGLPILIGLILLAAWPYMAERRRAEMDDAARHSAPGKFVSLSQGKTHYQWHGPLRGPVAVCVHGLTTPSFVWDGMAEGLADLGYRVLVYDLFGRGYSDRPAGVQDADFFLTQLEDLLADQGIDQDINLFGYSMGGSIATAFAARHPGRVRQLILLAPAGIHWNPGRLVRFILKTPLVGEWLMYARFPALHIKGSEAERSLPSTVRNIVDLQQAELKFQGFVPAVFASMQGILSGPLQEEHHTLHREGVPVLAVWGKDDEVIPISALGILAQWNRTARQEVIEGAGHGLTYTHTDDVLDAIREVLRDGLL